MNKNETLMRWAGFQITEGEYPWRYPDGTRIKIDNNSEPVMPNLLCSLDAQAKWLWPKLVNLRDRLSCKPALELVFDAMRHAVIFGKDPAEACAEMIWKLMT